MHKEKMSNPHCKIFDAYYEEDTREWAELTCFDHGCEFCSERPEKHPEQCECLEGKQKEKNDT